MLPLCNTRLCPLIPIDDHSCDRETDHGEIVFNEFFVACCDFWMLFDPADGALNDVFLYVDLSKPSFLVSLERVGMTSSTSSFAIYSRITLEL